MVTIYWFNCNSACVIIHRSQSVADDGYIPMSILQEEGQMTTFIKFWQHHVASARFFESIYHGLNTMWHLLSYCGAISCAIPHPGSWWLPSLLNFLETVHTQLNVGNATISTTQRDKWFLHNEQSLVIRHSPLGKSREWITVTWKLSCCPIYAPHQGQLPWSMRR